MPTAGVELTTFTFVDKPFRPLGHADCYNGYVIQLKCIQPRARSESKSKGHGKKGLDTCAYGSLWAKMG